MSFVARASEHFHPNHIADRDLAFEQRLDAIARCGPGVAKKFDPCGRINQNHVKRLVRNSPRSASQPRPTQMPGFLDTKGFRRQGSKRKVDRRALCRQVVTAHDRRARLIVDIYIGA